MKALTATIGSSPVFATRKVLGMECDKTTGDDDKPFVEAEFQLKLGLERICPINRIELNTMN